MNENILLVVFILGIPVVVYRLTGWWVVLITSLKRNIFDGENIPFR